MDEAKKKQLGQIGLLVVLLLVLVGGVIFMQQKMQGGSAGGGGAAPGAVSKTEATDMSKTGVTVQDQQGASSVPAPGTTSASKLNPNMWRVYSLTPPKNPFVQQESWYADTFRKLLPGYPEIGSYFEKPGDVLPNMNRLFGDKINFDKFELARNFKDKNYSLTGTDADGSMTTTLKAHEVKPADVSIVFDRHGNKVERNANGGEFDLTDQANGTNKLPLPGGGMTGGSDGMTPGMGEGEALGCTGISIHGGHASALMQYNGSSYIVQEGGGLPPRFSNAHITDKGVQLKDTSTGKTRFIELKAPVKDDDTPAVMRGRRTVTQS